MKITIPLLATAVLLAASTVGSAQGVSGQAPGHQEKGLNNSPGASGSAPGQKMLNDREKGIDSPGPGASGYAPGHSTTGSGLKPDKDDMKTKTK